MDASVSTKQQHEKRGKLMRRRDLTGERFGRLTVVSQAMVGQTKHCVCRCDCGEISIPTACNLVTGKTKSCGCFSDEVHRTRDGDPTDNRYAVWTMMVQRCENPKHAHFGSYGGRGIKVCESWRNSFLAFANDMGDRPEGSSIDRIDNDGDYERGNCEWASSKDQANNRRSNRMIEFGGRTQTLAEWGDETGISPNRISRRIKAGWGVEKAMTEPVKASSGDCHE